MAFASRPLRALALEEEEEEEEGEGDEVASAENAFQSTERVLAPKGDDPLDSEKFRKRQDLKKFKPWTPEGDLFDLTVPVKGKGVKLANLLGDSATVVMNIKLDDPETINQIPALKALVAAYKAQGLRAILIPTDQVCVCVYVCTWDNIVQYACKTRDAHPHRPCVCVHKMTWYTTYLSVFSIECVLCRMCYVCI
jgi:hypothetical protein